MTTTTSATAQTTATTTASPAVKTNRTVEVRKANKIPDHVRYPVAEAFAAAAIAAAGQQPLFQPRAGLVCPAGPSGKPLHAEGFRSNVEFLGFLGRVNYVHAVNEIGNLRWYEVATPRGWVAYGAHIKWGRFLKWTQGLPGPAAEAAMTTIKVEARGGIPILTTSAVLPREDRCTFWLKKEGSIWAWSHWVGGWDISWWNPESRVHIMDTSGMEVEDQLEEEILG